MPLRLAEAQQLYDGLSDALLRPALTQFFQTQRADALEELQRAVLQNMRDTMKEARLAGRVDAYEKALPELQRFAEKQLREATQ